ncbi:MAG: DEAD/DEAH box helicase family protein [Armatimonadetes bacterium]|nr:DEAD/DEAH box helicase family protein [Armatimonadota bacterium]
MPRIFDNIEQQLLPALRETIAVAQSGDFCVGYFNLRGWRAIADHIEPWLGGEGHCCRVLVGMQRLPEEELRLAKGLAQPEAGLDNSQVLRLKQRLAEEFRNQLTIGLPTNEDEASLRQLAAQMRAGKVKVKLFLRHALHAKLYLLHRQDPISPVVAYLGSSNLTFAGLARQGELNVDVLDADACAKLCAWFEDRWDDRWCVDITAELIEVIEQSWARETLIPPYQIYLKMAYHLCQEAREGLAEFRIPKDFRDVLFEFQAAAVRIAAHHLNKRRGVLIGDVVGLGKTLMATALARIFEEDQGLSTLIICPVNLQSMWQGYIDQYGLRGKVVPISRVQQELPELPGRFRLVVIDESHNLRNREGSRYRAIAEYIQQTDSRVILLSATPYNKTYLDLSSQLRLFVPETEDLGIRPERLLEELGETEFVRRHQCPVRSLAAFEKSEQADDWRELMRRYLVRRTRGFIQANYAALDEQGRAYLTMLDGNRVYFPRRLPKRVLFDLHANGPYARLYHPPVVDAINALHLPRYGLGNYLRDALPGQVSGDQQTVRDGLSRAGKRLMGFCRTNLFKRLESSGQAFILSVERHILRNYVFLHAIEADQPLPIGTQDAAMLDTRTNDGDADAAIGTMVESGEEQPTTTMLAGGWTKDSFRQRAAQVYEEYAGPRRDKFKWLPADFFTADLANHLRADSAALLKVLHAAGPWDPAADAKLAALEALVTEQHPEDKVLIFSQFADTVRYLTEQLARRGVTRLAGATGDSDDPTLLARRFSPESNRVRARVDPTDELRVLVATDVLSEGQNLQDCAVVVNYDLPWAIIRLIQRAGRVDRIGQQAHEILCYSFLPAEGIERIIRLRARVRQRLHENSEVVGTDEAFFDDDQTDQAVVDLYNEKAGILDGEEETEVDLASEAYQIWRNATDADPTLKKIIPELPAVVHATKARAAAPGGPPGALVYIRTADGNDSLVWMGRDGQVVTQSPLAILRAAACPATTPAIEHPPDHYALVARAAELALAEEQTLGGGLGRPSGARFRTYERLQAYVREVAGTLFDRQELHRTIEDIYRYPLRQVAVDALNRQLRSGISDEALAELVMAWREENRLCIIHQDDQEEREPRIICSMGLATEG